MRETITLKLDAFFAYTVGSFLLTAGAFLPTLVFGSFLLAAGAFVAYTCVWELFCLQPELFTYNLSFFCLKLEFCLLIMGISVSNKHLNKL